ncbi:MAG: zinc ribbon domain-containing protein [Candidatus Thorarchaeota archaeon]
MENWRKYTWVLPIIGAIILIISISTPVMDDSTVTIDDGWDIDTYKMPLDIWMVGYYEVGPYDGWVDELADFTDFLIVDLLPFIICFIGLLIGVITGIAAGVSGYRGEFRKNIATISGILMITFTLLFIIWVEVDWSPYSGETITYVDEWDDTITVSYQFDPGFGIIGPFIGGAFCIVGGVLQQEERVIPIASKRPGVTPTLKPKYCPHCGAKVAGKFCSNCGKSLLL